MNRFLTIAIVFLSFNLLATETETNTPKKGNITGTIIDSETDHIIEYATISIYNSETQKLITGEISDSEGFFRIKAIPPGTYKLSITFMGYRTKTIENVTILPETKELELGNIVLELSTKQLEGVNVIADQSAVQYKIDKKVVNVSQMLTAKSGTAVDILENVPSVKVDIEGNVSLRGSTSFIVLIDGRPTALEPSDALSQIPAGAIDNIEIITNPSAKYEPDGTAGIINIVTKKNKLNGVAGVVNANVGRDDKYGADFTIETRKNEWHYYLGGNYNKRNMPGDVESERWTRTSDTIFFNGIPTVYDTTYSFKSDGSFLRKNQTAGLNGGIDWNFTDNDVIGISLSTSWRENGRDETKDYLEWTNPETFTNRYASLDKSSRRGTSFASTLDYKHTYNKNADHYLELQINADGRDMRGVTENLKLDSLKNIAEAKKSDGSGPMTSIRFKLDYSKPLTWGDKLEAGFQAHLSQSNDKNLVSFYDTALNVQEYVEQPLYSNKATYNQKIFASYATYGGQKGNFGYQAGLRVEYTYWLLKSLKSDSSYTIDRPDFFPTLHLSYNLPADQQAMLSYTRRIERPRGWFMAPFITFVDANNLRKGNPGLKPEYINSFELSYQKKLNSNFFSIEGYYRVTQNKIEEISEPLSEGIWIETFENIGSDYAFGTEFMFNYSPTKWYTTNLMADLYDYRMKASIKEESIDQHSFTWSARFNNTFKASVNTRIQFDFSYQGPEMELQGTEKGEFGINLAVKQDFLKRKASATLQFRDLFNTTKHDNTTKGATFYQHNMFKQNNPMVMLTLSYKINNYKSKERNSENGRESIGGEEDGGF